MSIAHASPPVLDAGAGGVAPALALLAETRQRTLALVSHLGPAELERVHSPVMGPLVWDLAHIAAYEDLWLCHDHGRLDLLRPELARIYDAFATPRVHRRLERTEMLDTPGAFSYMDAVRERTRDVLERRGPGDWSRLELVVRHELQHTETMRQTMNLACLLPAGEPPPLKLDGAGVDSATANRTWIGGAAMHGAGTDSAGGAPPDGDWVEVPAGRFPVGAPREGFAYDNERPQHEVRLGAFAIASRPLLNVDWHEFRAAGGYERREWWSPEGWAWLNGHAGGAREPWTSHPRARRDDPHTCLCHLSWFEADALARSRGARLPSEAEWEVAARLPAGLPSKGLVWEWTSSQLRGYPGFRPDPYPEYSEVFFDRGYRVLRGSSWATAPRVASASFRNWDLPQRRQLFAGARLAQDR
jgi:iron(II)-dependent oxidoreductase